MYKQYKYLLIILLAAMSAVAVFMLSDSKPSIEPIVTQNVALGEVSGSQIAGASTIISNAQLIMPISEGLSRVTKKPFGLYVNPEISPVDNDIFVGFHTGIDFETNANETNANVAITAACEGKVLVKEWAKGYGGVLVQSCKLDGEDVTVIYGHLKLESIEVSVGQTLKPTDKIGYLGQGYSHETDGRRKHLHFDIHKGTQINILGYTPVKEDLSNWVDPIKYLK